MNYKIKKLNNKIIKSKIIKTFFHIYYKCFPLGFFCLFV